MARCTVVVGVILIAALGTGAVLNVDAGGKKSDSEVKVTATVAKSETRGQVVTVMLEHNKGWHTYANPVGNADFDSNKTLVTFSAGGKPVDAKIEYPVGKVTKDTVIGDYKVYENKTQIVASLRRPPGDNVPLEVSVRITACHEKGVCLLPATVKVKLP